MDYTFEMSGRVAAMRAAFEMARPVWGETLIVAVAPAPGGGLEGRAWSGSALGAAHDWSTPRAETPRLVDWMMQGSFSIETARTRLLPFERINEGFEMMQADAGVRPILVF